LLLHFHFPTKDGSIHSTMLLAFGRQRLSNYYAPNNLQQQLDHRRCRLLFLLQQPKKWARQWPLLTFSSIGIFFALCLLWAIGFSLFDEIAQIERDMDTSMSQFDVCNFITFFINDKPKFFTSIFRAPSAKPSSNWTLWRRSCC
jgi:hypothetical protein